MDDLRQRLRAARPMSGHRDLPLSDRAKRELAELILQPRHDRTRRLKKAKRSGGSVRSLLAVLVLAAPIVATTALFSTIVVTPIVVPAPAAAVTPEPLTFVQDGRTAAQIFAVADSALQQGALVSIPLREVRTTGWYYDISEPGTDEQRRVLTPQVTELTWNEDMSGSTRTVAGVPYWADGAPGDLPAQATAPGELLGEHEFAPGEFNLQHPEQPGDSTDEMLKLLESFGMTDASNAYDIMENIVTTMQVWTLTNQQHAELLRVLTAADGIRVLGTTKDRAGTPVVGLATQMPHGSVELHLFVSTDSGRIVGSEKYTLKADSAFPGNAVISYSIWENPTR